MCYLLVLNTFFNQYCKQICFLSYISIVMVIVLDVLVCNILMLPFISQFLISVYLYRTVNPMTSDLNHTHGDGLISVKRYSMLISGKEYLLSIFNYEMLFLYCKLWTCYRFKYQLWLQTSTQSFPVNKTPILRLLSSGEVVKGYEALFLYWFC